MISLLFVGAFLWLAVAAQKPVCLITAPYVVHLGVDETVSVQLHGASKTVHVLLYFQIQLNREVVSDKQIVTLYDANHYQAIVNLKASTRVDPLKYHGQDQQQPYVQLVAESEQLFESKRVENILLSTRRGHIFIQTDKPIYNPGEKVQYRIFTLDNYMLPIDDIIVVKIYNCKGLLVYSHVIKSKHILDRSITIPDVELAGHWNITASYKNYKKSISSVEFEVREYVLPSFEVNIKAFEPYHTLSNDIFQFNISARYTYGKGVSGVAYVRFGLVDGIGERTLLPGTEKQAAVEDGDVSIFVLTSELESAAANQNISHIEGLYLYIAATVLEKASGDLEEAESSSVKIVTSPYVIDLSKTKKYFSPGGMFSIRGTTTYPDGSRVPHMKIKAVITINPNLETLTAESTGDNMGEIAVSFKVPRLATTMFIMVSAEGRPGEVMISDAKMEVLAVEATGESYLSVEVPAQVLQPGQNLQVTFRDVTPPTARPSHIYYLVVSKGRVLRVDAVPRTDLTSVHLDFSADMAPSFRLVAYYYTERADEIVADSVWVDVKDVCEGKVEIAPFADMKPAQHFEVSVRTDWDSTVALSAVDSAVYILNKKNKLSPQKMFDYMNSYDLGCSMGGGKNSGSVLQGVGLTFICSCRTRPSVIAYHVCNKEPRRQKRDLQYNKIANRFNHKDRKCCNDGKKLGLMPAKSCDERLRQTAHQTESCRRAFKACCEAAAKYRKNTSRQARIRHLGRTSDSYIEDLIDEVGLHLRSYFPQSWMWVVMQPHASGDIRYATVTPDSITTWEVQAVSVSPSKGFCVADPQPLRVFQDFFVSVKLPYSVKRNEQLELKAVVYNYKQNSLKVTVKLEKVEGLCTAGGGGREGEHLGGGPVCHSRLFHRGAARRRQPSHQRAGVHVGLHQRWRAETAPSRGRKAGEGELVSIQMEYNINAKSDKKMELHLLDPEDKVPGQDSATYMSFKGGVMGESVDNCLNLKGVEQLIQLPTGCAEQTMVKLSPAIHAIRYLDATNQWLYLNAERREEAQTMIQSGYNRILTYKKDDGSYGAFLKTPSSIWLTAFIAKELTGSRAIIEIVAMSKAESYLVERLDMIESPYAMAITAYALSLKNPQSQEAQRAHRKLMQMATCDKDRCFWEARGKKAALDARADALSVEATAYGLLHAVSMQDKVQALRIATWLTQQRKYGGGFRSTQDTVIALEALSKFSIHNNDVEDLDLKVEMCVNNGRAQNLHLTRNNALTQEVVQVKEVGKVAINVKGRGKGTLTVSVPSTAPHLPLATLLLPLTYPSTPSLLPSPTPCYPSTAPHLPFYCLSTAFTYPSTATHLPLYSLHAPNTYPSTAPPLPFYCPLPTFLLPLTYPSTAPHLPLYYPSTAPHLPLYCPSPTPHLPFYCPSPTLLLPLLYLFTAPYLPFYCPSPTPLLPFYCPSPTPHLSLCPSPTLLLPLTYPPFYCPSPTPLLPLTYSSTAPHLPLYCPSPTLPSTAPHIPFYYPSPTLLLSLTYPSTTLLLPLTYPSTAPHLPLYYPSTAPHLPLTYPSTAPHLPFYCPSTAPPLPFYCPLPTFLLPLTYPSTAPHLPLYYPSTAPHLPLTYPSTAPHLPLTYPSTVPHLPFYCPSPTPLLLFYCPNPTPLLPLTYPSTAPHLSLYCPSPTLLLPLTYPSTALLLLLTYPSTAPHLPFYCPSTTPLLPLTYPSTAPHLPLYCPSTAPHLPLYYPSTVPHLPLYCPSPTLLLPLTYPSTAPHLPSLLLPLTYPPFYCPSPTLPSTAPHLPFYCPSPTPLLPLYCPSPTLLLPLTYPSTAPHLPLYCPSPTPLLPLTYPPFYCPSPTPHLPFYCPSPTLLLLLTYPSPTPLLPLTYPSATLLLPLTYPSTTLFHIHSGALLTCSSVLSPDRAEHQEEQEQYNDYYHYEAEDEVFREEPMSRADWFDLRSRRRRHAPQEPRKESVLVYTVCLRLNKGNSSSMVVVDISLLSGLSPNIQDLEDNVKGTEKYIDHYDVHHNKVFLYFNQITETEECVRFRADQLVPVGLVQPAAAVLYDYYSPERRCGIFYTAPKSSTMLNKLCKADVCTCAEGGCARSRVTFSKSIEAVTRKRYACYSPSVDYIYTIRILNSSDDAVFTTYSTLVTKVLQTGKDVAVQPGAYLEMAQRVSCDDVQLKNDANYLVMGEDDTIFTMNEAQRRFLYILDNTMWIEEIPAENKCKASRNKVACQLLWNFIDVYFLKKCSD
ncbi:hypothetical protein P4O66_018151 [Electrophorus voltai]|uniref:Anaphylatoxin-like domain-containing protein n=1 Tax=Electrophorus voltai TaxID=2609070 RepID=A0AAD9DL24_9TELE|nr:hypothetical protein P4O66_018151 [Electrophorus voltai]